MSVHSTGRSLSDVFQNVSIPMSNIENGSMQHENEDGSGPSIDSIEVSSFLIFSDPLLELRSDLL